MRLFGEQCHAKKMERARRAGVIVVVMTVMMVMVMMMMMMMMGCLVADELG